MASRDRGVRREAKPEGAADPFLALDPDAAAVLLDNRLADRQPESGAALFARVDGSTWRTAAQIARRWMAGTPRPWSTTRNPVHWRSVMERQRDHATGRRRSWRRSTAD